MQKIVFVLGNYKNGGMAMRATNLSNEFASNGFSVDILVTKEIGKEAFITTGSNVRVIDVKKYSAELQTLSFCSNDRARREKKIRNIKRVRWLTKFFSKLDKKLDQKVQLLRKGAELRNYFLIEKPNIAIPFGLAYLEPVVTGAQGIKCKIIYAEKNAPEIEFPSPGTEKYRYYISLLKQVDGVIVQTQNSKSFFEKELDKVYVINNPVKNNLPAPYQGIRKKTIVNFCRITPQKNLDLLIDAFTRFHQEYPDYCLKVYGNTVEESEEQYKNNILQKVDTLKLNDCVLILPPAADVHNKIIDSAMFISSSDYEGLSNSMIEAMAIGLPCICTDCLGGGTREVMRNEENGLIVPIKDAEALYRAMRRFIEEPEFAEKCGQNASAIRDKLDVKKIAQKWLVVLQR